MNDKSPEPVEQRYFSPDQFAEMSGLSIATVRRYLATGKISSIQPGGCRCRKLIPVSVLDSFLRERPVATSTGKNSSNSKHISHHQYPKTSISGSKPNWLKDWDSKKPKKGK